MKKICILAVATIISAAASAKSVETESFTGIRVNVPANVRVVRGDTYGVRVSSDNKAVEKSIRSRVVDGVLVIDTRDLMAISSSERLRITVIAPTNCSVSVGRDMVINSEKTFIPFDADIAMK